MVFLIHWLLQPNVAGFSGWKSFRRVVHLATNDEAELLTEALAKTVDSLNSYIQDIQTSLGSLSSGDYAIAIPDNFDGDFISSGIPCRILRIP